MARYLRVGRKSWTESKDHPKYSYGSAQCNGSSSERRIITKNPTIDCKPPKLEKREMRVIQPEQVSAYLRAAADRNVLPMFYLELTSGLRKGELLALLWSDLDVEKCSISVTKACFQKRREIGGNSAKNPPLYTKYRHSKAGSGSIAPGTQSPS